MLALVLFVLLGSVFGYFATLNTAPLTVNFGTTSWENVPTYLVVLVSVAIGILYGSLYYLLKLMSHRFMLGKKNRTIDDIAKENTQLTKRVHQLELENIRLKTQYGEISDDADAI